jgi:hypothetical protein
MAYSIPGCSTVHIKSDVDAAYPEISMFYIPDLFQAPVCQDWLRQIDLLNMQRRFGQDIPGTS